MTALKIESDKFFSSKDNFGPSTLSTTTSNGYVVGQDATNLSAMNAGLEDRFKKQICSSLYGSEWKRKSGEGKSTRNLSSF